MNERNMWLSHVARCSSLPQRGSVSGGHDADVAVEDGSAALVVSGDQAGSAAVDNGSDGCFAVVPRTAASPLPTTAMSCCGARTIELRASGRCPSFLAGARYTNNFRLLLAATLRETRSVIACVSPLLLPSMGSVWESCTARAPDTPAVVRRATRAAPAGQGVAGPRPVPKATVTWIRSTDWSIDSGQFSIRRKLRGGSVVLAAVADRGTMEDAAETNFVAFVVPPWLVVADTAVATQVPHSRGHRAGTTDGNRLHNSSSYVLHAGSSR